MCPLTSKTVLELQCYFNRSIVFHAVPQQKFETLLAHAYETRTETAITSFHRMDVDFLSGHKTSTFAVIAFARNFTVTSSITLYHRLFVSRIKVMTKLESLKNTCLRMVLFLCEFLIGPLMFKYLQSLCIFWWMIKKSNTLKIQSQSGERYITRF